jgi:hypothetical protein
MSYNCMDHGGTPETTLSAHDDKRWRDRQYELARWIERPKLTMREKKCCRLGDVEIDAELYPVLSLLKQIGIETEFSCAGVSPLDEPEDHSLYAYITFPYSALTERFVNMAMRRMKHRLLVTYEPGRQRYDLSSFYIGHNRSFCLLMESCARSLMELQELPSAERLNVEKVQQSENALHLN